MISRRKFIGAGASLAAAAALPTSNLLGADKPMVAVSKGKPVDAVMAAVKALGGMERFVKNGDRVVLKANLGFPNPPEWATTTNPEVVKTVAQLCLDAGARRVIIADHPLRDGEICKERTGIEASVKGMQGVVVAMMEDEKFYQDTPVPGAKELKTTAIAKEVLRANCLINIPVAKCHSATGVSLGIKNLMGLVWDRKVFHEQMELNRAIAEQLIVMKPKLTIVDAMFALVTNGPAGPGKVEKLDTIVASADPVAADSYTVGLTRWYGRQFSGDQVKYIKIAAELGFGVADVAQMNVIEV